MAKQERLREAKQHGAAWFPFNIYPCTIPKDFPQVALHWQDSMELVFVKKGRGIVQAGLTTYTAQAGDIYVFAPGVLHALRQLPGPHGGYFYFYARHPSCAAAGRGAVHGVRKHHL